MNHAVADGAGRDEIALRRQSWSRYWSSGALHSFADSFGGRLGPSTVSFWARVFRLLDPSDRVLELGCGNGALVRFLCERHLLATPAEVDAIDMAQISPEWVRRLPPAVQARVRFHSGVRMEALPFEDRSMSYVVGQYAIEYAGEAAWNEVLRVLRPIARIGMILHHHDSLPVRAARIEAAHIHWLLGDDGPYHAARALIPYLAMASTEAGQRRLATDPQAAGLREDYNRRMAALLERARDHEFPDVLLQAGEGLNEVMATARSQGRDAARALLESQVEHIRDGLLRLEEAVEAGLDGAAMAAIAARLHQAGFADVEYRPLTESGALFGWSLYAHRSA